MRILLRGVLAPIFIILALASILEVGLRLRELATSTEVARPSETQSPRVLFIYDSIGGFIDQPFSVANKTVEILRTRPQSFEFFEMSRPALRSIEVVKFLRSLLDEVKPQIAVMMIGKSDFQAGHLALPEWFLKLRISRVVELLLVDIWNRYLRMLPIDPKVLDQRVAFAPIWKLYADKEYEAAIPLFESALRAFPNDEAALRALYACYIATGKERRGHAFFSQVDSKSENSELAQTFAITLKVLDSGATPEEKKQRILELQELAAKDPMARNSFKTSLWMRKEGRDANGFSEMLRNLESSQSSPVLPRTSQNLRTILGELNDRGIRTILLQYPTDHISALENSIGFFSDHVETYETRTWLLENPSGTDVVNLIEDDVEHLTPDGAAVVSQRLAEIIRSR